MYTCMSRLWCQWFLYIIDVMSWCACILIFFEVVEYLYACMIGIWYHWFSCLGVPVYIYSPKLWHICMLVWPGNEVNDFILRDACMLVFPKVTECLYTSIVESIAIYVHVYNIVRLSRLYVPVFTIIIYKMF
jgi:hypothetical protein